MLCLVPCNIFCDIALAAEEGLGEAEEGEARRGRDLIFQRQRRGREGGREREGIRGRGHKRERGREAFFLPPQGGSAIEECTGPFLKPPFLSSFTSCHDM